VVETGRHLRIRRVVPGAAEANNPNNCFNWFLPSDTRRDHGEALSIRQMIERMSRDHGIDRRQVFVVGLSVGGAMAAGMLGAYPDLFAGGAIIAGLPYGSATNVQEAFESMANGRDRSARAWSDLVRKASDYRGPWPRISLWHGSSDAIVNPRNMEDALKQWIDVHGVSVQPRIEHEVEGHSRRVWRAEADDDVIEVITIAGMGHGVPLASGRAAVGYGNSGFFHFDVGLSSSHHILRFWGLADERAAFEDETSGRVLARLVPAVSEVHGTPSHARESATADSTAEGQRSARAGRFVDPSAVIAAPLTTAGLLNEPSCQRRSDIASAGRSDIASVLNA